MKKRNILYITLYLPVKNLHGGATRMFEQIRYLSTSYNVYVLSFLREEEEPGLEELKSICKDVSVVRIRGKNRKSYSFFLPGFVKNYHFYEMESLIVKKTSQVNFDLVQFEYLPMAQYKKCVDIKSFLTEHQLGFLCLKKQMQLEKKYLKRIIYFLRYKRLLRYENQVACKFNRVIFISKKEAECAKRINAFVSSMGVDAGYFKADHNKREDIDLIYTGNFDSFQNEDSMRYFFDCIWPLLKKRKPKININIIGYKSKEKLSLFKKYDGVNILGYVDDIREYLDRAKIFVVPARIGGGMRGKLLEALAMERPVVSTGIGSEGYNGEILKVIKVVYTPEDFTDTTIRLLEEDKLRKTLGRKGRTIVENEYTWINVFSKMDALYENISNNSQL